MNLAELTIPVDRTVVERAIADYERGFLFAALEGLRSLVACNEDSAEAHFAIAMSLKNGNSTHWPESYQHFERCLELRPGWGDALYNYARVLSMSSREGDAQRLLLDALALEPDDARLHEWMGLSLIEQARFAEALPYLERAAAALPDRGHLRQERDRVREALKSPGKLRKLARYPRAAKAFENVEKVVDDYILNEFADTRPFLRPGSKVFTMGSCFASNIAVALRRYGVVAKDLSEAEEINSTFANRWLIEWIANGDSAETLAFSASFGEEYRRRMAYLLESSDVFIMSLGVAACFFDRETGAFVPTHGTRIQTSLLIKNYAFRTTTVRENTENLQRIVELVRAINPGITVILTVSPVPLKATFERLSPIIADCISKSTLRAAAHEYVSSEAGAGTIYWPSFEIFRWLGGHVGRVFGTDDGSAFHPDQGMIEMVMAKFVERFGDASVRMRGSA